VEPSCTDCKHFSNCYPLLKESDNYVVALLEHTNAIRKRDLCCNNDKYLHNVEEWVYKNE